MRSTVPTIIAAAVWAAFGIAKSAFPIEIAFAPSLAFVVPRWLVLLLGVSEVALAVALLVPGSRKLAALLGGAVSAVAALRGIVNLDSGTSCGCLGRVVPMSAPAALAVAAVLLLLSALIVAGDSESGSIDVDIEQA